MEGEQLPSVEVDGSGSVKLPQTEAQLKKVTKELSAPVKTVKIQLHPRSLEDHVQLRRIMGTARWTYNQCIRTVRDPNYRADVRYPISLGSKVHLFSTFGFFLL